MQFFSSCSLNFQDLALAEAHSFGLDNAKGVMGGVEFEADFQKAVEYCLLTRLSSRLLMRLANKKGLENIDDLKSFASQVHFEDYFSPSDSICVTSTIYRCEYLNNTMLASQVVKDGICDRQRQIFSSRSYVDKDAPRFTIHIHLSHDEAVLYLDFSGQSLCKRHYRVQNTEVYLQEHTSAAVLMRSGYSKSTNTVLVDPFCGSGTILIEAALMLTNTAPGIIDPHRFAFINYKDFDSGWYDELCSSLRLQSQAGKDYLKTCGKVLFYGFDCDKKAIEAACKNAQKAGVGELIHFECKGIERLKKDDFPSSEPGFLVTDPPYNARVKFDNIEYLYKTLGDFAQENLPSWNMSILTSQSELLGYVNLHPDRSNTIMNGSVKCTLAHYKIYSPQEREELEKKRIEKEEELYNQPLSTTAQMIYNRLEKNRKNLAKFLQSNSISCYRLYDADMNEYSAAVDVYEDKYIVLQEYEKGKGVREEDAQRRLDEIRTSLVKLYGIPHSNIYTKTRSRQRGSSQYAKLSSENQNYIVRENGLKFLVNFTDYLDTGLFLDHRYIRNYIRQTSNQKRFLNLFCYTASATVYAMAGGALSSVSVDASEKYLGIGRENLKINFLDSKPCFFKKSDVFDYLKSLGRDEKFDVIFLDPPSFSNNKSRGVFDIQKDHVGLIKLCLSHLDDDGELIFSTNLRTFKMDDVLFSLSQVEDISLRSIDEDFRDKKIHQAFLIHKKGLQSRGVKEIADEIRSFSKKCIKKWK